MNSKFQIGDPVKTAIAEGTVADSYRFPDHFEYFVKWPDQTLSWIHEDELSPAT